MPVEVRDANVEKVGIVPKCFSVHPSHSLLPSSSPPPPPQEKAFEAERENLKRALGGFRRLQEEQ